MEDQIALLGKNISDSRNKFSTQRKRMFTVVKRFKYPLVGLTALSTIVPGLELGEDWIQWRKNIALVIGAIVTLLTTLMTFWNVEEYWLQNKVTEQELEILEKKFKYSKAKGFTQQPLDQLVVEYSQIISQQQTYWKTALDDKVEDKAATNR